MLSWTFNLEPTFNLPPARLFLPVILPSVYASIPPKNRVCQLIICFTTCVQSWKLKMNLIPFANQSLIRYSTSQPPTWFSAAPRSLTLRHTSAIQFEMSTSFRPESSPSWYAAGYHRIEPKPYCRAQKHSGRSIRSWASDHKKVSI